MIKGKFLLTAVLTLFLASCGDDEAPQGADGAEVKFTAGFVSMQTAGADTRLTTNCRSYRSDRDRRYSEALYCG